MVQVDFTIVMQWINFGILLFLLHRLLFKPVLSFLDKRSQMISSHIDEALNNKEKSLELLQEYEDKLKGIQAEADKMFDATRKDAEKYKNKILEQAKNESQTILQATRDEVNRETAKAKEELTKDISTLVIACTTKVLEREVSEKDHKKVINEFLAAEEK